MGNADEGVCEVLNRVIKKALTGKMTFLQKSEGGEGVSQAGLWERAFQTEGTAGAKALRWERAWQLHRKETAVAAGRKVKGEKVAGDD